MTDLTASGRLEHEAATILGYILLEFSRLEMALGLALSGQGHGRNFDGEVKHVEGLTFYQRLGLLKDLAYTKYGLTESVLDRYLKWIERAHAIRQFRNDFFHGRWGLSAARQMVVNVVGLPGGPGDNARAYALSELEGVLRSVRELAKDLAKLMAQHPV